MKKIALILSFLLILTIVPFNVLADADADTALIDAFKEEFADEISKTVSTYTIDDGLDAIDNMIDAVSKLDEKSLIDPVAYDVIETNTELTERCVELGIVRENVSELTGYINDALEDIKALSEDTRTEFLFYLKGVSNYTIPTEVLDIMDELRTNVNENLSDMVSTLNSKMASGYENSKGEFAVKLTAAIYDNVSIKENSDDTWTAVYDSNFEADVNSVITTYTDESELTDSEIETLQEAVTAVIDEINEDKGEDYFENLKDILIDAEKFDEYESSGGGGSNDGGSSTGGTNIEDQEVNIPENEEDPVEVELSEDAVEVSENDEGQTEAVVDGEAVNNAIENLLSTIEEIEDDSEDREAVVTVEVEADSEDLAVNIPVDAVENLIENNIGLQIKTDKLEYDVPAGAIDEEDLEEFGEVVTVQFNSKVLDDEEAFEDIELDSTFTSKGKVLELSLDVLDSEGEKVGSISKFNKPLIIKVSLDGVDGDNDRLGVYYLNPETGKPEFVGGKIANDKIVLKIYHYSKYAILESNITYSDLTDHWSKLYVESMAAKYVVNGYPDGTYIPEKNVTRAEFAKLIVKALELDMVEFDGEFSDIDSDDWCADYVATAAANGIVSGYTDGTFMPNKEITRLEMATMIGNTMNSGELNSNAVPTLYEAFTDARDIAEWGRENAARVYQEGLMVGMDGKFEPQGTTTRAQAATAIYRLFNK